MCSSKLKQSTDHINGRPVLQPKSNQVPILERRNSLKKISIKPRVVPISPPISPSPKSTGQSLLLKTEHKANRLNSGSDRVVKAEPETTDKKFKKHSLLVDSPGSIAAARREQVAVMQEERRQKISHYGRTKSAISQRKVVPVESLSSTTAITNSKEEARCGYVSTKSDPIYIAYHDEEWGVPVHDDVLLFELLTLTGAQVGSNWTCVLQKRQALREAFSWFDSEVVAKFTEKNIASISVVYDIELRQVRGIVDNSKCIVKVKKEFGSFAKYLWGFINHKPICNQYRSSQKVPLKTSKSEAISKDMIKRGFRLVGPTIIQSFMQAAGLTNDHLITCPRHLQCMTQENLRLL